jgi:uncharacterized protein YbjT (DUF2867 family)
VRPGSHYYKLNDSGCDYFFGDLRDPRSLRRALRGCERLVHAAQVRLDSTDNHQAVVLDEGSRALWAAAAERGVRKVVMTSCLGVESELPHPAFACQAAAEASLVASGLPHTILRCAPFVEELLRPRAWGMPESRISPLSRDDAAIAVLACLDDSAPTGAIALGGPEAMSVREAIERAHTRAGSSVQWMPAVGLLARAAGLAGRRWRTHIERMRLLHSSDLVAGPLPGVTPTSLAVALERLLVEGGEEEVYRTFAATVYEPGSVAFGSLPEGPLREVD